MLDPAPKRAPAQPLLTQFLAEWGIDVGNDVVVDAWGMGQMFGTDASVPVARLSVAPDHRALQPDDGLSAGALDGADRGRRRTATPRSRSSRPAPQSWAETDLASLVVGRQVELNADKGDQQGRLRWPPPCPPRQP